MLWASARSVREERSRQRYALQDFSLIKVSLVKGKGGWKIGSVESERSYFGSGDGNTREARVAITTIFKLLRQFLHGEMSHGTLFDEIKLALEKVFVAEDPHRLVDIFTLRFLHSLGYIASQASYEEYLTLQNWFDLSPINQTAIKAIEKAKQVSHL